MNRCWLLTWTTYGTWLPGDERGFVSNIDNGMGHGSRINQPGTKPVEKIRGLQIAAKSMLKCDPIYLSNDHAQELLVQFQETAEFRNWKLIAVAIMRNHVHVLVGVPDDPDPDTLLRDFKSYGSRRLNRLFGKPISETWWTEGGSKRKKDTESDIFDSVEYVMKQEYPLLTWLLNDSIWSNEKQGANTPRSPIPIQETGG